MLLSKGVGEQESTSHGSAISELAIAQRFPQEEAVSPQRYGKLRIANLKPEFACRIGENSVNAVVIYNPGICYQEQIFMLGLWFR
jgi:hypothetical protein